MIKVLLVICSFLSFMVAAEDDFPGQFISGNYILVGQGIDTEETYSGKVSIYLEGKDLKVKRVIRGRVVYGVAQFEPVLNGDSKALRIRFLDKNIHYEETCLWSSDLDNYARISCYLYISDANISKPGLEVLFIDHSQ